MAEGKAKERDSIQVAQHRAVADIQTQLDKLLDMATRGMIDDDEYKLKSASLKSNLKYLQDEQANTAHRVKNWYEIITETIEKLTNASDKFKSGDLTNKKDILLAIGQNPILIDKQLAITPNEWLIPVAKSAKNIREQLEMVRTMPQQIQKASEEALMSKWCRERDSNPRRLSQMIYSHPCLTASLSLQIYGADDRT